jgi:hypothetical protein
MSKGFHSFRHNDAARLIRATEAAGKKVKGVTLKDGVVRIEVDDAAAGEATKANPLDRVRPSSPRSQRRPTQPTTCARFSAICSSTRSRST